MIPPEGVKIFALRKISYPRCTLGVNFTPILKISSGLAIIVLAGQRVRRNTKRKSLILELGHYCIVGTVKGLFTHSRPVIKWLL